MQDKTIDRRGLLGCMAWVGTGALWTITGGVPGSRLIGTAEAAEPSAGGLSFVQISDSHIGFNKAANTDVTGTLRLALDRIEALRPKPAFMLHTGDISHLSKEEEFDTAQALIRGTGLDVHYVPGEHDMLVDEGATYLARFGKGTRGAGWHSFDVAGVHFVGLVNVVALKAGGLGRLGAEQLEWLEDDLRGRPASQPIVVFAHIPLWSIYPAWGWGTDDAAQALSYLRRFGSVTVLNGHIHQVMQKIEGNVTFHTALSTAFPQPRPGKAASPGPMTVPAEQLKKLLGTEDVAFRGHKGSLAIVDRPLAS